MCTGRDVAHTRLMHDDDRTGGTNAHISPQRPPATPLPAAAPRTSPPTAPQLAPPTATGAGDANTPSLPPPAPAWVPAGGWAPSAPTTSPAPVVTPTRAMVPAGGQFGQAPPSGPPQQPRVAGASGGPGRGGSNAGNSGPGNRDNRKGGGMKAALIGGLVGAIVAGGITAAAMTVRDDGSNGPVAATASVPSRSSSAITGEDLDIRALLEKVQPSVVSIHTGTREGEAAGSGIVLNEEGLVLTNAHVIEGANSIEVDFADGQTAEARVIGKVESADVALVQAEDLDSATVPAELGSSGDLLVGDEVVAIGNALNLGAEPSVTTGIVSQTGRSISAPDGTVLDDLIQTDAAINPGNSGGPLINARGQVVGVNTAILADAQNIGFALEIDSIRSLIDDLESGKSDPEKERPVLGVATLDVAVIDQDVADRFGVTATSGAFVQSVTEGSGAEVAGMQAGDVIVEVDGRRIRTSEDVGQAVRALDPGSSVKIVIDRDGEEQTVNATLGSN